MAWFPVRPPHSALIAKDADDRLPLITISIVRTISFTMYTSTKRILNSSPTTPTSSRKGKEREVEAPWVDLKLGMFNGNSAKDVAVTSLLAGGASGAVVCVGSAPFELVKVGLPLSLSRTRSSSLSFSWNEAYDANTIGS